MTKLFLVRHGETVDNARQVMQGQMPGELNEAGIRQARELCERMRHRHFDAFIASDLKRAVDTCRILAEPHGLPVVTTPLLRERDWGDFTGVYIPDLKGREWPANVESLEAMLKRARDFLDFVASNYPGCRVVAVGHGIMNKAIQAVYYHKEMKDISRMENADVRVLDL